MTEKRKPEPVDASEIARREAEAAKYLAEAEKARAETRIALARAADLELGVERDRDMRSIELAADWRHKVYVFDKAVDAKSAKECMAQLTVWARNDPGCEFEIILNTPGGEVTAGLALFDYIRQLSRSGHKVTTSALGMAASMGSILLQAGDHRRMARESWLLIHEVQAGAIGSWGEITDRVKWLDRIQERLLDLYADRAAQVKGKGVHPITRAAIKKNWTRTDWWLDSAEALRHGIVDEIA